MRLSEAKMERLDARYTAYNPDQEVDGPDALVDLVCPIHGPYRTRSENLRENRTKRTLKPPRCPGCKSDKQTDIEYLTTVKILWSIYNDGNQSNLDEEDYPIAPEFGFMEHWKPPIW